MADLTLAAQPRTRVGRKVRQLRMQGLVPVVVYGKTQESTNLQVSARELERLLHHGGSSQLVEVNVEDGSVHNVLIRDVQRDPVSHAYLHADFYAVDMTQKQEVSVPVLSVGTPSELAVGLMMFQALDSVNISALPSDIPANIEVDVTGLTMDEPITIADLPQVEGVEYAHDLDEAVFSLITTRVEEEVEAAETFEEVEEVLAEPEVLTGRHEEEEEGEEAVEEEEE